MSEVCSSCELAAGVYVKRPGSHHYLPLRSASIQHILYLYLYLYILVLYAYCPARCVQDAQPCLGDPGGPGGIVLYRVIIRIERGPVPGRPTYTLCTVRSYCAPLGRPRHECDMSTVRFNNE